MQSRGEVGGDIMIIAMESTVTIEGNHDEVIVEAAFILHQIYFEMVRRFGKEEAEEQLDFIVKIAHMSEEKIESLVKADTMVLEN